MPPSPPALYSLLLPTHCLVRKEGLGSRGKGEPDLWKLVREQKIQTWPAQPDTYAIWTGIRARRPGGVLPPGQRTEC